MKSAAEKNCHFLRHRLPCFFATSVRDATPSRGSADLRVKHSPSLMSPFKSCQVSWSSSLKRFSVFSIPLLHVKLSTLNIIIHNNNI